METTTTTTVTTRLGLAEQVVRELGEKAHVSASLSGMSVTVTLRVDCTSRAAKLALCARKDALVKALTAAGLRCKKADGLRYTGSQYSSMNTGLRYEFRIV